MQLALNIKLIKMPLKYAAFALDFNSTATHLVIHATLAIGLDQSCLLEKKQ